MRTAAELQAELALLSARVAAKREIIQSEAREVNTIHLQMHALAAEVLSHAQQDSPEAQALLAMLPGGAV